MPPKLCHSRLPRHLIVRKVSAGPSGPGASTASLSAGQTERHSVLGPGSFFPFSHRLCLISNEYKSRKCQITPKSLKVEVFKGRDVICRCVTVDDNDIFMGVSLLTAPERVFFIFFPSQGVTKQWVSQQVLCSADLKAPKL